MFFVKKQSQDINYDFIKTVVNNYFTFIKNNTSGLSGSEISELLRYSMCLVLNLQTKGYSTRIEIIANSYVKELKPLFKGYNIENRTIEYKQGVLEACVHCMEMSRKRANV